MKKKLSVLSVLLLAVLFTWLFHRKAFGLNVLLFEVILFTWFAATKEFRFRSLTSIVAGAGLLITALFTVLTHSVFVYVMNLIALMVYLGLLIYPDAKSFLSSMALSLTNVFSSQILFLENLTQADIRGRSVGAFLWKARIFLIPLVIIVLFIIIYGSANPVFAQMVSDAGAFIQERWIELFRNFDALVIGTFLLGLLIANQFVMRRSSPEIVAMDAAATDALTRRRRKVLLAFKPNGLRNEYKAGVFLLIVLNAILLLLNAIDIHWVWFNFDWQAQDLKQFVHAGTYMLILSILISVAIVLFFFRGNLNFYARNRWLKRLSYCWILQNGILAVSVAIRNFYYISHFSLAYKRIGVILFLLLTLYGLYTVWVKVFHRRSAFYLLRSNAFSIYVVLVIGSCFNWDSIIARYNFSHADKSFLHLEYLSTLSDKTLPYLDKTLPELQALDRVQDQKFPFAQNYMSPEEYDSIIKGRREQFLREWEQKGFFEWNLAEYRAYRELKK